MALTGEEQRRCYLYTGNHQVNRTGVFVGGQPHTTEAVHALQVSLDNVTPNGETTVRALLVTLDGLYAELFAGVSRRLKATKLDGAELNPKEWEDRMTQWNFFRRELARTLDVALDPASAADAAGCSGPYREP